MEDSEIDSVSELCKHFGKGNNISFFLKRSLRVKPEKNPCQGWAKALEEMMGADE